MLHNLLDPNFILKSIGLFGLFFVVFAETGLFFGFFLPGDSLLITAGILSSQGVVNVWLLALGSFIFAVYGDSFGYWFGKKIGKRIFTKEDSFLFRKSHVRRAQDFYEKYGNKTIFFARFLPIVRTFAPIVAGVADMKYKNFINYNIAGGFVWSFLMVFIGYFLGNSIPNIDRYIWLVILIIVAISFIPVAIELIIRKKSHK